ncbi:MAG: thioredoxin family protein [Rhodobacteraceae bacterium]|nr:thioredoxin family protein [Paracoccaceae bacterium]
MKKQSRKPKAKRKSTVAAPVHDKAQSRRAFLRWARNGALALPVVGVGGFLTVQSVQASICEADLTKIGNGKPAIVQIHDPQCTLCQSLMRQTRRALRPFDGDTFSYLVANVNTQEGQELARTYNVPHVTLLLFDGAGELVEVLRGTQESSDLRPVFAAHLDQFGASS